MRVFLINSLFATTMTMFEFNSAIALTGLIIFFSRIVDVSLGTLRTISIVQGRQWMAFWLGFFEVIVWLIVISTVIHKIQDTPVLGIFYALGFAAGNMAGIRIEGWLALGSTILRVISKEHVQQIADCVREHGYTVTIFHGEGKYGPVAELYIVCLRRDLKAILQMVQEIEPTAFYVTEPTASVSKIYRPLISPSTGWRAVLKKK